MTPIILLLTIPGHPFAICAPQTWNHIQLVEKLGALNGDARIARMVLLERPPPDAVVPVLWGCRHADHRIAKVCLAALEEWQSRRDDRTWRSIVDASNGDYDRCLNGLLREPPLGSKIAPFEVAAELGRILGRKLAEEKMGSLNSGRYDVVTPYQPFRRYVVSRRLDVIYDRVEDDNERPVLARTRSWKSRQTNCSIIIADGDVEIADCGLSIIIAGGDVRLKTLTGSLVISAGRIQFVDRGLPSHGVLVASDTISFNRPPGNFLIVTPLPVDFTKFSSARAYNRVFDDKNNPPTGFFTFRDLWTDYGFEASLDAGRVKITKARAGAPFSHLLQPGDIILARDKLTIDSVGQFRRLLSHSLDLGSFNFSIERAGKTLTVRADLQKKRP